MSSNGNAIQFEVIWSKDKLENKLKFRFNNNRDINLLISASKCVQIHSSAVGTVNYLFIYLFLLNFYIVCFRHRKKLYKTCKITFYSLMNENNCWLCLVIKALNRIFPKFRFLLFTNSDQYCCWQLI